jgi:hypothetical protein
MRLPPAALRVALAGALAPGFAGCPTEPPAEAEIDARGGSYACADDGAGPAWTFAFAVDGPARDDGSSVFVESDARPNDYGYAMTLFGRDGDRNVEFEAELAGTPGGAEPAVGDVPFDCPDLPDVQVLYCATHRDSWDEPCWACGDESMGSPPGGSLGWIECGD